MPPLVEVFDVVIGLLRPAVFVATAATAVLAGTAWAARTGRLSPFGGLARALRPSQQRVFGPMERRLVRAGGMPGHAPWWTVAVVGLGGLLLISVLGFLRDQIAMAGLAFAMGGRALIGVLLRWTFALLNVALFVRVIGSWVGGSPYSKWFGWAYRLTEPLLAPIRQLLPSLGPIDISPLVLYFGLQLLESVLLRALR
ncbi:MAG: YggT family protein [Gemmatimonadaceae bacterium]|jgi:YggT family protein|nr:YggT family protein [Gemmatimonadaceae bacterium]